jgi:hypothetical protein
MGFLAPSMLLGGLAVGVPIALHFFYRARYRRLPWAAMTFLRQAIEQTSRRVRFQEWVLLALRCLVLLLLALALARPTFQGGTLAGRGESVDAVLVIDTSASMTARDGEKTRLERAKEAAVAVIDNLPPHSTVQIFGNADRAAPLGPVSPGNLDQARQIVAQVEATALASDVLPGLTEAYSALDRGAGTNKEVYLFTDVQKGGWDRQAAAVRAKCDEIRQRAGLFVVRCGSADRPVRNVAVVDITHPAGIPHTGTRMPFTVLVRNTGKEAVRDVAVALEVDGKPLEKEGTTVPEIEPGATVPVTLTAKLDQAGPRVVTATVSGDDLPADNRLDRVIAVREQVRVLMIDGTPDVRDPKEAGSHYVRNAVLPVPADLLDDYYVRGTVVAADEAGPGLLGVADVVFLLNVPASNADRPGVPGLSPEFVARLAEFVKTGGGLVIGCGDNVVPARYNAVLGTGGANLLPFDLDAVLSKNVTRDPPEEPFRIAADAADGVSFLARFRDEPYRTVTAEADLNKVVGVREADGAGRAILRLTDGRPFVATRTVGGGEVVFVAGSLDERWGNWPGKAGSFLSFVNLTLAHLTGRAARGSNRVAGEPLVWQPPEAAKGFDVVRPDGRRVRLGKAATGPGGRLTVTAPDTPLAGVYAVGPEGEEPVRGPRFAVAPDLRETDNLDALADGEVEQLLGFRPTFLSAGAGEEAGIAGERARREWTVWALLGLFVLAVGESVWAWFCGRAW